MFPPSSIAARRMRWSGISLDGLSFSYDTSQHRSCKDNAAKFRTPFRVLQVPIKDRIKRKCISIFTIPACTKEREYWRFPEASGKSGRSEKHTPWLGGRNENLLENRCCSAPVV